MSAFFKAFAIWLRSTFSEADGTGSSSRLLTFLLAIVASAVLGVIVAHVVKITDPALLTAWLTSFPIIIGALVLFFTAPYGVNKGSGSFTDIISALKGRDRN